MSAAALTSETEVLAKCDYFQDVHLWPRSAVLNSRRWLDNFTPDERPYAAHLLGQFQFFSMDLTDALLKGAFDELSRSLIDLQGTYADADARWQNFVASAVVTYPTGETPSPTDSGFTFARKARQVLGIRETNIMQPDAALEHLSNHGPCPVLFVDDFLGSGSQIVTTWHRNSRAGSFATTQKAQHFPAYYLPLLASDRGLRAVATHAPGLTVAAAHELPAEYSALHPNSLLWPDHERSAGQAMIKSASKRAGFPDTGGHDTGDWRGFAQLGLAVAFAHSVPDATLPLFHAKRSRWVPLVART